MKPANLSRAGQNPFSAINNQLELAIVLRDLCGAEGYRMEGQTVVAVRWDDSGSEVIIDRFLLTPAGH